MKHKGLLISFEGPDGAGKTTVLNAIMPRLQAVSGLSVTMTREPGGVMIAERIRDVILDPAHGAMDAKTELLLYVAARRQHLIEKIRPALEQGQLVLLDRFIDSSVAYQSYGRGLARAEVDWLNAYATDGLKPDLTLYFDVDSEIGLQRIAQNADREVNRLDTEALDLHRRVREGYQAIAQEEPQRMITIDASRDLPQVIEATFEAIEAFITHDDY